MLFDPHTNSHAFLHKMEPGSTLKPHCHTQPVVGYTL